VSDSDLSGTVLDGRYTVIEPIAEGAMGSVYRGERLKLGRAVAIKIMHHELPDELASRQRFEREAKLMALLEHPNCVSVIDFGVHDDKPFLVMDLVRGASLVDILDKERRIEVGRAADIIRQVLSGLAHAHELGIVHRDIKPANIMISEKAGLGQQVRILDFGLARLTEGSTKLTTGIVVGTPNYMAPEQCKGGDIDARTDLYACGVMFFEMLTGRKPFVADDPLQVVRKHLLEPPPTLASVDPGVEWGELEGVIARALSKAPGDRFESAVVMAKAVEAAASKTTKASAAALFARAVPDGPAQANSQLATMSGWNVPVGGASTALPASGAMSPPAPTPAPAPAPVNVSTALSDASSSLTVPLQAVPPAGSLPPLPSAGPYVPPPGVGARAPAPPRPQPPAPTPGSRAASAIPSSPTGAPASGPIPSATLATPASGPIPSSSTGTPASGPIPGGLSGAPSGPIPRGLASFTDSAAVVADAMHVSAPIRTVPRSVSDSGALPPSDVEAAPLPSESSVVVDSAPTPSNRGAGGAGAAGSARPIPQLPFTKKQLMIGAGGLFALIVVIALVAGGSSSKAKQPSKPVDKGTGSAEVATPEIAADPVPTIIEKANGLIADERYDSAVSLLRRARKQHPDNAELAFIAGKAYFGQLYWSDGVDSFRDAIKLDPSYKENPELLKTVLKGFLTTPDVDDRIVSFMRHDIGLPMRPYLEETAQKHPKKALRARAATELNARP
jgi:eukaryotic-like serine/threonine-protein kinase